MTNKSNHIIWQSFIDIKSIGILLGFTALATSIVYILFTYTEGLLTERLRERLIAVAATSAEFFEADEINQIKDYEDIEKEEFKKIVGQLNKIKEANPDITYAYLMRKTNDPTVLEFVADAESLLTDEELDVNADGIVQDDEAAPLPGDPFEISEYPVLLNEAFYQPSADRELEVDQWSIQLSAYAPIFDRNNKVVAIFGIDVVVGDFLKITRATFLPFLLFIIFLILLLTLLTDLLVRIWRERVQAVQELDRQKDELLGIVSHQLATPVASMKWYLEMLNDGDLGKLNKEQGEHIQSMQGIASNLSDLVSMILDVSRIQLGRVKIEKQELDLETFFKEITDVIQPKAAEKKINLQINLPKKYPRTMLDRRYTKMTIENLLTNAVKYTNEGGKVTLQVKIQDKKLYCEVKDTGMGIPKAEQGKIFGRMFRASNARNTIEGNGFGLYVAKGAVEAQGGEMWFESVENKGTTFFVVLPL